MRLKRYCTLLIGLYHFNSYGQNTINAGLTISPALNFFNEKNSNFNHTNFTFNNLNTGFATGVELKAYLKNVSIESGIHINIFTTTLAFDKSDFSGVDIRIYSKVSGYMYSIPLCISYPVKKVQANLSLI